MKRSADSLLTHLLARPLSRLVTPRLARTSITPLQVTGLSLAAGLLAAWVGSWPGGLWGVAAALLLELSHVLDCVDGELARLTGRGSPFAAAMDPISDRVKDVALIAASHAHAARLGLWGLTQRQLMWLALAAVAGWMFYMYVVDGFLNPAKRSRSGRHAWQSGRVYLGLYDLFIYSAIALWLLQHFELFAPLVLAMALAGSAVQLLRLQRLS
jgi:phosphatidylglycerophosphate synthase